MLSGNGDEDCGTDGTDVVVELTSSPPLRQSLGNRCRRRIQGV